MAGPLEGVRVIEAGLLIQGPQAGALLSDMGADVIKVELPGIGDQGRYIFLSPDDTRSAVFTACNRGKRSLTIDLRHSEGAEVFKTLVKTADIVISNFKPGTLEEWGLGFEHLAAENPRIIWAAGSTFGPAGSDAQREGADLAGQSAGGLISTTGRDGEAPTPVGAFIADHIGSLNMASGILAALYARQQTGRGQRIEVSLVGGQIWAQATEYTHFLMTGEIPGRANYGHPLIRATYRIFETADTWLGVIGVTADVKDAFFIAMGRPEWTVDDRFVGPMMQPDDLAWLKAELELIFRDRTTAEWCRILDEVGVRYAPVRDYREVADDRSPWDNGYLAEIEDHNGIRQRVVGTPIRMSDTPLRPGAVAPTLGEHTEEILLETGFNDSDIAALRDAGAI